MDPMAEEQSDFGDEECVGAQRMQNEGVATISALADDEIVGEDDEYDDLYNDVNVGEGFLQLQRVEATAPSTGVGTEGFQPQNTNHLEPRVGAAVSQQLSIHEPKEEANGYRTTTGNTDVSQKAKVRGINHEPQTRNVGFQVSASQPRNVVVNPTEVSVKVYTEPAPLLSSGPGGPGTIQQMPTAQKGVNVNPIVSHPNVNENQVRPALEEGGAMLLVGELHWWTTDAELESVLSQYGRIKEIRFFDERASGKSKGYCQVEFYDSATAAACKGGVDGHVFNGRPCLVTFASPQTIRQMATAYTKNLAQPRSQPQLRRPVNDGIGRGSGMNQTGGDAGRGYGRGGWGRGGQGTLNRGPGGGGHMRGRGGPMGGRNNMIGNNSGVGGGGNGGAYGQAFSGPGFGGPPGGLMFPQGMMGAGFDPTYMGRGAGYGGFSGPPFPGMLPSFPNVNTMGIAGVAPHVNPAFFGRGMVANGMGMMGPTGMEGPHGGMWTDTSMGGWGGDEHGQRTRETSYGGEDGASEYGCGEASQEKGRRSSVVSKEKDVGYEHEVSGNSEKKNRDDREMEMDRSDRDHRYIEEKDGHRGNRYRESELDYEDDRDREQSARSHSRSKAVPEKDHRR